MFKFQSSDIFKDATESLTKALAGDKNLEVNFVAGSIPGAPATAAGSALRLPLPDHNLDAENIALVRGSADAAALYRKHHDAAAHTPPTDMQAAAVYNALEYLRCEALGARGLPGTGQNMSAVFAQKCERLGYDRGKASQQIPLAEALHLAGYYALSGQDMPESVAKSLAPYDDTLAGLNWESLKIHDQRAFAAQSRQMLAQLGLLSEADTESEDAKAEVQDGEGEDDTPDQDNAQSDEDNRQQDTQDDDTPPADDDNPEDDGGPMAGTDIPPEDGEDAKPHQQGFGDAPPQRIEDFHAGKGLYQIYTTRFDEIVEAKDLADMAELTRLRAMLDAQLTGSNALVAKLANRLQRTIMARQQRRWQFELEEGILDGKRLARMIANPTVPLAFKQETQDDERDTIVSLLIDNSGSMRGRPIALAAMSADVIAQVLERCNVRVEILGFTTRAWKGGKAREHWIAGGRPDNPGRLNDLRHIIYKSADAPMRRARRNLGLMLKEGLLKENIDGEALAWAYNRLARRPEARKVLMVISDGAPVDDSTLSANSGNMLEDDLRGIIHWIENKSAVELTAIGIGHDVTRYYTRAMTLSDAEGLAEGLIRQLGDVFAVR